MGLHQELSFKYDVLPWWNSAQISAIDFKIQLDGSKVHAKYDEICSNI